MSGIPDRHGNMPTQNSGQPSNPKRMEILDDDAKTRSPEDAVIIGRLKNEASALLQHLRNGRIAIIVLMVFVGIGVAIGLSQGNDPLDVAVESVILIGAYGFALWYFSKSPKVSLIIAGSLYLLNHLAYAMMLPESLFKGIILKAIMLYFLGKAIHSAFEFEKIRKELKGYGEELSVSGI